MKVADASPPSQDGPRGRDREMVRLPDAPALGQPIGMES